MSGKLEKYCNKRDLLYSEIDKVEMQLSLKSVQNSRELYKYLTEYKCKLYEKINETLEVIIELSKL